MVIASEGALIIRQYEGPYINLVTYRQRCDNCRYLPARLPISVTLLPAGAVCHGTCHEDSFVCPFCENRQAVKLRG
jgi:hypothetical protein